jgi:hypothetical protein
MNRYFYGLCYDIETEYFSENSLLCVDMQKLYDEVGRLKIPNENWENFIF